MFFSKTLVFTFLTFLITFRLDTAFSPLTDQQLGYFIGDGNISSTREVLDQTKNTDSLSPSETGDYYDGIGFFSEAFSWYYQAARQEDGYSQNRMGEMLQEGRGVQQDFISAMAWYLKAHFNGILQATNNIGMLYSEGLGVEQNHETALAWHLVAAAEGYSVAQYNVGIHYESGLGIKVNKKYALEWYEKAAIQGHFGAKYAVNRLNSEGYYLNKRQKLRIHSEHSMKEQRQISSIKERIKLVEQQLQDTETEKKHIDLKLKSLAEELNVLKQKHHKDIKKATVSNHESQDTQV